MPGLNVEAAILNLLSKQASFERNQRVRADASEECTIGWYRNHDPEYVFTNKALRIAYSNADALTVPYSDIVGADLPCSRDPNWKTTLASNRELRQISLLLRSGEVIFLPIKNETRYMYDGLPSQLMTWDLFQMHSLFRKIAFFNRKAYQAR